MQEEKNKKIINATSIEYHGIKFKSKLEAMIFKTLCDEGFKPKYEHYKFHIWEGFKPIVPFYRKDKKTNTLINDVKKIIDITYTPDITFKYNNHTIFVEVKPDYFSNDVYPYKQKLFRKYLERTPMKCLNPIFVKVGTKRGILDFLKILKEQYEIT